MDQAISLLGHNGVALLIHFNPLRVCDVLLPSDMAFVIANSMKEHSVTNSHYNERVLECRLATNVLAMAILHTKSFDFTQPLPTTWKTMRELAISLQMNDEEGLMKMAELALQYLHTSPYSLHEVSLLLNMSVDDITQTFARHIPHMNLNDMQLYLQQRAYHVFTEASRVLTFQRLCKENAANPTTSNDCLLSLGNLMQTSHISCRDMYECSCDELDRLVTAFEKYGAIGARLTGAGWGGWAVSFVREKDVDLFVENLIENYFVAMGLSREIASQNIVVTKPSEGARLFSVRGNEWVSLE
jgi:N-acetylgalactosamine kinase